MKRIPVTVLAECALMLAVATILSFITVYQMPYGGTITLCSMVPLLYVSFHYPIKWATLTAVAFGLLQMLFAFFAPPSRSILVFAGVVLLDYLVAFGVLGLAGFFGKPFQGSNDGIKGMLIGGSIAIAGRFLCHFVSGILIWSAYAPEGQLVALYSLLYNGSFMLGEWLLSMVALVALAKILPKKRVRS